jgi:hypothetical protein
MNLNTILTVWLIVNLLMNDEFTSKFTHKLLGFIRYLYSIRLRQIILFFNFLLQKSQHMRNRGWMTAVVRGRVMVEKLIYNDFFEFILKVEKW